MLVRIILLALVSWSAACEPSVLPPPVPKFDVDAPPAVLPDPFAPPSGVECPVTRPSDGYWVPRIDVQEEGCGCYLERMKLNGERCDAKSVSACCHTTGDGRTD